VIQQWKVAVPWAAAGQVTIANGGDVGREASLYPSEAVQARDSSGTVPSSRVGERPAATASAPAGSALQTALDLVNQHRAFAGAAPLTADAKLTQAAQAHANYYVQNSADKSLAGMGLHNETAGKPGFTGASWTDRAKAAGYSNWAIDENMGLVGNATSMTNWCLGTINHRWNLLHPSAVHLGYGIATNPKVDVMDIGFSGTRPSVSLPTVYPGPGQTAVPTSADIAETPDPAPGIPRPLGFPITISFHTQDNVQFSEWALTDASGAPLQVYTYQKNWLKSFALIPAKPLAAKTTYNARISGVVNGQPFTKAWSFTTK
jgi:uncharacterized protein YkwD